MKIVYTSFSLQRMHTSLLFLKEELDVPSKKIKELQQAVRIKIRSLSQNPFIGQKEPTLANLNLGHRRIIESHFKIIYYIANDTVFVTDIFDSRQDPKNMKG